MTYTTPIPVDILNSVIEALAAKGDTKSLEAYSQTCHMLLPLCRKHLFSTITIPKYGHTQDLQTRPISRFNDILSDNPSIARYVKNFDYCLFHPDAADQHVLDMLLKHAYLERMWLWSPLEIDWPALPASLQSSILSLIQTHTLKHLSLERIKSFPAMALLPCGNLTTFEIRWIELTPPMDTDIHMHGPIPTLARLAVGGLAYGALETLRTAASIVDLTSLQSTIFESVGDGKEFDAVKNVLKTAVQLRHLSIEFGLSVSLKGLAGSIHPSAFKTLNSITLTFRILREEYDPIMCIVDELTTLPASNILEELDFTLFIEGGSTGRYDMGKSWAYLDEVLTSTGFTALRRAVLRILITHGFTDFEGEAYPGEVKKYKKKLEELKTEKFTGLSASNTVQFDFVVGVCF